MSREPRNAFEELNQNTTQPALPIVANRENQLLLHTLHREANDGLRKQVLKGTRWLLLMGEDTLDSPQRLVRGKPGQPSDREKLEAALKLNEPLATAYYLKEKLRLFWDQPGRKAAERCFDEWCRQTEGRASVYCTRWQRR